MKRFILEQSETEFYTSHSGLALVGLCLNRYGQLNQALEKGIPLRHGIAHADIIKSSIGTLCLGKSDFEAIENHRNDDYFKAALSIQQVPSSARLRQRLDEHAEALLPIVYQSNIDFLAHAQVTVTPLVTGHVALDIDVYPMNNEKTRKEGVSRTYKGFDGYAPIALYLGKEGWCIGNELREGKQHCQYEFLYSLERGLAAAKRLTALPLLVRLDGGHDALDNRIVLHEADRVDFIIKWNPRKQDKDAWLDYAEQHGEWTAPRAGKRVALFSVTEQHSRNGKTYTCRRVIPKGHKCKSPSAPLQLKANPSCYRISKSKAGGPALKQPSMTMNGSSPSIATMPPPNNFTVNSKPIWTSSACRPANSRLMT